MAKEIEQLGKSLLEKRLCRHGWRPKCVDREREASNTDIGRSKNPDERNRYARK